LYIASNDPNTPVLALGVQGNFVGAPGVLSVPADLNFGSVFVDGTRTLVLPIANSGCGDLSVTGLSVTETDPYGAFSITAAPGFPFPVVAGATVHVSVTFAPSTYRAFQGQLTVAFASAGVVSSATVTLNGIAKKAGGGQANIPPNLARLF